MSYDLRDFIFDLCKEAHKGELQNAVHQRCVAMRQEVLRLPEEDREVAMQAINNYEQGQMQGIFAQAENASAVKEVLKQLGF